MKQVYNDYKAEKFLSKYIPIAKNQLVSNFNEIKLKPPFVLKIISDDALHKTDVDGVRIIKNESEIEENFLELIKIAKKKKLNLEGIMIQDFIEGENLIIGIKKDEVFNHVILFGVGGIFTEVIEDISIRKCPINKYDAQEMIDELRAKKIFYGFRGEKLNIEFLKNTLVKVSKIPIKYKQIKELDINPFILNKKDGKVVDARIVF